LLDNKNWDLSQYRLNTAKETLIVAQECFANNHYKDAINRSYYAAFYAARAVLAVEGVDFKRHKDVVAHFNKEYVATGKVSRDLGRLLARLQQKREQSDYDDFFIASREEAEKQLKNAISIVDGIKQYLELSRG
jgi:uncharacterized protein (UPF0332 family)